MSNETCSSAFQSIADVQLLQQQRQAPIDQNRMRANRRRVSHDYQPNEKVLLLTYKLGQLDPQATGPLFTIHVEQFDKRFICEHRHGFNHPTQCMRKPQLKRKK